MDDASIRGSMVETESNLYFRMIWRNTISDQTKRHRQSLVHVDLCAVDQRHGPVCRVEACGSGADDGHAEGPRPVMPGGGGGTEAPT